MSPWAILLKKKTHEYNPNCWCSGCINYEERRRTIGKAWKLPKQFVEVIKGKKR